MGVFGVAAWPYSLKLLWSPLVDALYWRRFGRRKSWVVPVQLAAALLLVCSGGWIEARCLAGEVVPLTALFFAFVLLAATQDIAVDGWALTLLRPPHVEYAATCQTLGMNVGYFTSFTLFLALENAAFCDARLRPLLGWPPDPSRGVVSLGGYVRFWGWAFAALTAAIAVLKREGPESEEGGGEARAVVTEAERVGRARRAGAGAGAARGGRRGEAPALRAAPAAAPPPWRATVASAYASLWGVVRLPAVGLLTSVLVTYRLGVLPAEGAAALKLLDKGAPKEALAALVLAQFPVELLSALLAGRWASRASPATPFLAGYAARLVAAALMTLLVAAFPPGAEAFVGGGGGAGGGGGGGRPAAAPWMAALAALGLVQSFASTLMFTALGSFFNRVSDPAMGGAYLTLLNTIANMGVVLPKTPAFALIDALTVVRCHQRGGGAEGLGGGGDKGGGGGEKGGGFGGVSGVSGVGFDGGGGGWARAWAALGTWAGGGAPDVLALAARPLVPGNPQCPQKPREHGGSADGCAAAGGACVTHADGFYLVSGAAVLGGLALLATVHARLFRALVALPAESWRVVGADDGAAAAAAENGTAAAAAATTPRTPRAKKAAAARARKVE